MRHQTDDERAVTINLMAGLLDDLLGEADGAAGAAGAGPPQGPGIPALPPDPNAISAGLDAIRARDPAFDEGTLLAQARQVWHRTTGAPDPPLDASISAATAGPSLESVTVRFATGAAEEDWVFQRSTSATTPAAAHADAGRCPNCGAPLQLDAAGTCPYCRATVFAAPGWTLAARNRLRPMTADDRR